MSNPFKNRAPGLSGPATDIMPVTPSDSNEFATTAIALYVVGAGTVAVMTASGTTRSFAVPAYSYVPLGVRRVLATGTTATGIHALLLA
ncbi:MAG: hypothetical protein H6895_08620 [Defluviimonas sp.]|uniref:spike base protein, RCAP_Rcc01079 family n=1 Tax=Albidovulum sp. TaxID=1872424 RepID=UPI001D237C44|nr:hypothetical protein [Paracoccaceae bacterium]MCC0064137.1 hypothetical protein [Defluviimonas sp.]